jgi:PadR family transcriptional regulator, regulatory protein PadR
MAAVPEVLPGTLDLLVLKTLSLEPMHGWGIVLRIQQLSADVLQVNQGSLYPALNRLVNRGWITAEWKATENSRNAKYYSLTPAGRAQLQEEISLWERYSAAVGLVIRTAS